MKNHGTYKPYAFIGGPLDGRKISTHGGLKFHHVARDDAYQFARDPLRNPSPPRVVYVRDGDVYKCQ